MHRIRVEGYLRTPCPLSCLVGGEQRLFFAEAKGAERRERKTGECDYTQNCGTYGLKLSRRQPTFLFSGTRVVRWTERCICCPCHEGEGYERRQGE